MEFIPQVIFIGFLAFAAWLLFKRIRRIKHNIQIGRPYEPGNNPDERWQNMLLIAFGQKKMFKKWIPAFLHLFIYVGFIIINIEVLEIIIDGVTGKHRVFLPWLGNVYPVLISFFEFLALAVLTACTLFLIRRNILKVNRLRGREMTSWPKLDANLILIIEILLMAAILSMNATDQILQARNTAHYPDSGRLYFSSFLMPLFAGIDTPILLIIERFCWWFHIIGILAFAVYITYSKHLHIFMAFPNTYYTPGSPKGKMTNMDMITQEVKSMLGISDDDQASEETEDIPTMGAKDVNDLTWKNLMDAYACTECGRCTSECPANLTGKKLSPRKIMMDTRDRLESVGQQLEKGQDPWQDNQPLLGNYISEAEINACTSCNACVEACPVNINPLQIILEMRRYMAMEASTSPASWNNMFANIENNFAPWKFPAADRFKWANDLKDQTS